MGNSKYIVTIYQQPTSEVPDEILFGHSLFMFHIWGVEVSVKHDDGKG